MICAFIALSNVSSLTINMGSFALLDYWTESICPNGSLIFQATNEQQTIMYPSSHLHVAPLGPPCDWSFTPKVRIFILNPFGLKELHRKIINTNTCRPMLVPKIFPPIAFSISKITIKGIFQKIIAYYCLINC